MASMYELQLLEDLRHEWSILQLLIGDDPGLAADLDELSRQLAAAEPDEIIGLVADLLDLVEDTAAAPAVEAIQKRAAEGFDRTVRGGESDDADIDHSAEAHLDLAHALRTKARPQPMPIFFGTNRTWVGDDLGSDKAALALGRIHLTIPVAAGETGIAEVPRWWNRHKHDPDRFIVAGSIDRLDGSAEFERGLAELAAAEVSNDILVVVHGFNVNFLNAARGAAQFGWNTQFAGPTVLFSWPSAGRLWEYGRDGDYAEASSRDFAEFLGMLAQGPWGRIHVLAHSMGNRVLVGALAADVLPSGRLGSVTYVAADVSRVVFGDRFEDFAPIADQHTLYASDRDRAIGMSSRINADRIGRVGPSGSPFEAAGLESVVATNVKTGILSLGHSYHMTARPLMTDLEDVFNKGEPAQERAGLRPSPDANWWFFPGD